MQFVRPGLPSEVMSCAEVESVWATRTSRLSRDGP